MRIPGTRSLAERWPDLATEFDAERNAPLTANDIASRSLRKVWWTSATCGHSWQDSPWGRTGRELRDCPACGAGRASFVPDDPGARTTFNSGLRSGPGVGI